MYHRVEKTITVSTSEMEKRAVHRCWRSPPSPLCSSVLLCFRNILRCQLEACGMLAISPTLLRRHCVTVSAIRWEGSVTISPCCHLSENQPIYVNSPDNDWVKYLCLSIRVLRRQETILAVEKGWEASWLPHMSSVSILKIPDLICSPDIKHCVNICIGGPFVWILA